MKIDRANETYETLGRDNILFSTKDREEFKATHPDSEYEVHMDDLLTEFACAVADKYPHWELLCSYRMYGGGQVYYVHVLENNEELGMLSTSVRGNKRVFEIRNDRIYQKMDRGGSRKTESLEKAMKLIAKEFGKKTVAEVFIEGFSNARSTVNMSVVSGRGDWRRRFEQLMHYISEDLMSTHFETITKLGIARGYTADEANQLLDAWQSANIRQATGDEMQNGTGRVVVVHEGYYAVSPAQDSDKVMYYDDDTVPADIKRGVGMLKLVENDTFISGVGARVDNITFFLHGELSV